MRVSKDFVHINIAAGERSLATSLGLCYVLDLSHNGRPPNVELCRHFGMRLLVFASPGLARRSLPPVPQGPLPRRFTLGGRPSSRGAAAWTQENNSLAAVVNAGLVMGVCLALRCCACSRGMGERPAQHNKTAVKSTPHGHTIASRELHEGGWSIGSLSELLQSRGLFSSLPGVSSAPTGHQASPNLPPPSPRHGSLAGEALGENT